MSDCLNVIEEVRVLWNAFIENQLDEPQKQRFDELVTHNHDARVEYIGLMNMHCTLSRYLASSEDSESTSFVAVMEEKDSVGLLEEVDLADVLALDETAKSSGKDHEGDDRSRCGVVFDFLQGLPDSLSGNTFQFFVLLALLVPSVLAFLTVLSSSKHDKLIPQTPMVARAVLAEWDSKNPISMGSYLGLKKPYVLSSGFAEIAFPNEARVIFQGPASFVIDSQKRIHLQSGRCVAHVPPMAVGFTIDANGAEVVDLGTEFGVETSAEMETDVYVFEGRVELGVEDALLVSKIQLTANQGVCASGKTGVIRTTRIDTDRFIRSLTANGVLASLPIKNASFEEPNLSEEDWTKPDGTLRSVPVSYWRVSESTSAGQTENATPFQNPDIGYYLWSSQHGPRSKSGVTDGNQACVLTLRDGTTAETKANEVVWVYYSLGRIRPQDVGHSLVLSADGFARTPRAESDAKITLALATETSDQDCGDFVGKARTVTGSEIWRHSEKLKASFVMPIELVGRELFVVVRVEDRSPGSGEDCYLIDNVELDHYHP